MNRRAFLAITACTAACAVTPPRTPSTADLLAAIDRSSPLRAFANQLSADDLAHEESFLRDAMKALVLAATVRGPNDPLLREHSAMLDGVVVETHARLRAWKPSMIDRASIEASLATANLRIAPDLLDEVLRHAQTDTAPLLAALDRELHRARFKIAAQVPTSASSARMPADEIKRLRDHSVLNAEPPPPDRSHEGDQEVREGAHMVGAGILLVLLGVPVTVVSALGGVALLAVGGALMTVIGAVFLLLGFAVSVEGAAKKLSAL